MRMQFDDESAETRDQRYVLLDQLYQTLQTWQDLARANIGTV